MVECSHAFVLELRKLDGQILGPVRLNPDWRRACEWIEFMVRRKARFAGQALELTMGIEPLPHSSLPPPYTSGFRVTLKVDGKAVSSCEFPISYFNQEARDASTHFVTKGLLNDGEKFFFLLMAYPQEPKPEPASSASFAITPVASGLSLKSGTLSSFEAQAMPFGEIGVNAIPVFIPQEILEQTAALTRDAGAKEQGGILIGHLYHDESIPDIGVVITAQIPARHTCAESHQLTFTPETWSAARHALAIRRQNELWTGWWHSHPERFWLAGKCKDCPPEKRQQCILVTNFFSEDDRCLHETVFPKAFQIALVVTHREDGLKHALFGWAEDGLIHQRGFHVLKSNHPLSAVAATTQETTHHENSCRS